VTCERCHGRGPTQRVQFHQNIGLLLFRLSGKVSGDLCPSCVGQGFWSTSLITLVFGWWGVISFFVTPFFLLGNFLTYHGALRGFARVSPPRDVLGRASLAWGVLTLPGLGFCGVASVPGLLAAVGGLWKSVRSGLSPAPALAGATVNGATLAVTVGLALLLGSGKGHATSPGESEFRRVNSQITSYRGQEAFGNTPEARQIAGAYSQKMAAIAKVVFSGGRDSHEGTLTEGHFLTHVEMREDSVCFLVHVPQLRAYQGEVRKTLLEVAWTLAHGATGELGDGRPLRMAVALRGVMLYGAVATGTTSAEEPSSEDFEGAASTEPLYAFFSNSGPRQTAALPGVAP
jgi:hypothetical protein